MTQKVRRDLNKDDDKSKENSTKVNAMGMNWECGKQL
jgi:hypothetical protein